MELRYSPPWPEFSMPVPAWQLAPLGAGFAGWLGAIVAYRAVGFSWVVLALWAGSVCVVGWGIYRLGPRERILERVDVRDLAAIAALIAAFAPLYLVDLYSVPFPIHNDEVRLMILERNLTLGGADLFGVSRYLSMPILLFATFGWIGRALGGVGLTTMRAVHASFGVIGIALCYVLFRQSMRRFIAFGAAAIVGINHSLWMLSRMALWDNSAMVFEVAALAVLVYGFNRRSATIAFAGGAIAGLGFYYYIPARVTMALWLLLLAGLCYWFRREIALRRVGILFVTSMVGCLLVATPLLTTRTFETDEHTTSGRFMLLPDGLDRQRDHMVGYTHDPDVTHLEAYLFNASQGLTAFNNRIWDGGGMYSNPGHGFVDPLTGVLLWIGVFATIRELRTGVGRRAVDLLAVLGLVSLWLVLALVVNQAPNYTRMLVTLPLAAYLAARGLERLGDLVESRLTVTPEAGRRIGAAIFTGGLGIIIAWNVLAVRDYVKFELADGDPRGATARYLLDRRHEDGLTVRLISDGSHPYYEHGWNDLWLDWTAFWLSEGQQIRVQSPERFLDALPDPPMVAFMPVEVYELGRGRIADEYEVWGVKPMMPDGSLVAVEAD